MEDYGGDGRAHKRSRIDASSTNENKAVPVNNRGIMHNLIYGFDWSSTALGSMDNWPVSLKVALDIALSSKFTMILWYGPDLQVLYNDAYIPILGTRKHPHFLGKPGRVCWSEIWHIIGPMLMGVMKSGEATWM